jgi:hypothetical protein
MTIRPYLAAVLCLAAASSRARAEDEEVDVRAFEYVDVVETADGSVWKGVLVEQVPNVQYKLATADGSMHVIKSGDVVKISKQKNRDYRAPVAAAPQVDATPRAEGVGTVYEPHHGLPQPKAKSGLRLDPALGIAFPIEYIKSYSASPAPEMRAGYEVLFRNFGVGGGGMARLTYWMLPAGGDPNNAAWTLETHVYGRAAFHVSRATLWGGASLGVDTNYVWDARANMAKTALGFGANLQSGVEIAASQMLAFGIGVDYHPPLDTILDGAPGSIAYYALHVGASLRL